MISDKKNNKPAPNGQLEKESQFWPKLEVFCQKIQGRIFILSLLVTLLISYLLFDVRVSLSGDDAAYIGRAKALLDHFEFPGFQGPLYPFFLAPFVALFGVNVVLLKTLSLFCILGFQALTYFTFRNRIPAFLLCATLLLISVNAELLYYASQTYSEAFCLLVGAAAIWYYVTRFIDRDPQTNPVKLIVPALVLGFLLLCLGLVRSIGFAGVVAVLVFGFTQKGRWKETVMVLAGFLIVFFIWQTAKDILWKANGVEFSGQLTMLLQKDAYNRGAGQEDIQGFFVRFLDNMNNYLGYHFYEAMGLRKATFEAQGGILAGGLTFVFALCGLFILFRKNKPLTFLAMFSGAFLVITFFIMHTFWNQGRLIMPVVPYLVLCFLGIFYYLSYREGLQWIQHLLPVAVVVLLLLGLGRTSGKITEAKKIVNKYTGLTPDWVNYVKMSEWAGKQLPEGDMIACRKPSISFIYAEGREFYGIYSVPSVSGDSVLAAWRETPENILVISAGAFNPSVPEVFYRDVMQNLQAYFYTRQDLFFVVEGTAEFITRLKDSAQEVKIVAVDDADAFLEQNDMAGSYAIYPDRLLDQLKNNGVNYVITANLRSDPSQNTGRTVSTVERYISYIEQKYPGIFTKVQQIGTDAQEPAGLLKIDYSKAK